MDQGVCTSLNECHLFIHYVNQSLVRVRICVVTVVIDSCCTSRGLSSHFNTFSGGDVLVLHVWRYEFIYRQLICVLFKKCIIY